MKYKLILTITSIIALTAALPAQKPIVKPGIPEEFCISENEFFLARKLNDYRLENNLRAIPLSVSLFFVAQAHAKDLARNHPDVINCNEHSWSDNGTWKPCCYSKEPGTISCMTEKPKEITGYKGKGYEMIYWDSEEVIPDDALDLWKSIPLTKEMLLNQGKWKSRAWKSCGVGIFGGYASVWFGDASDQLHGTRLCRNDSVIDIEPGVAKLNSPVNSQISASWPLQENGKPETIIRKNPGKEQYYIIVSSCKSLEKSGDEVAKFRRNGYSEAKILSNDTLFRIALKGYDSKQEAQKALNKLASSFKGIWILKY